MSRLSHSEVHMVHRIGSDLTRILRLAFLSPDIVDRILNGSQPPELTTRKLSRLAELPHSWVEQRALFVE